MVISTRRLVLSIVLGVVVAAGLYFVQTDLSESPRMNTVREVTSVMMMPATLITALTHQIHSKNFIVINFLSFAFYTLCFYGILSIFAPRKQKP
jgi:hypothetical protein